MLLFILKFEECVYLLNFSFKPPSLIKSLFNPKAFSSIFCLLKLAKIIFAPPPPTLSVTFFIFSAFLKIFSSSLS
jgi:hypothetical protein